MSKVETSGLKVAKHLKKAGFQAFFVGGIVRNMLMKLRSDNVDIATDAAPDEIEKVLRDAGLRSKPVGKRFGSILTIVNGFKIEITTFRAEGRYSDNRHPDKVEFIKDYKQDAKRRDFTINALYFDPIKKEFYDPTNGQKDLKAKLLRFVGEPKKRIDEDALRLLRGVRLATQLGFKLEKNSFAAIKTRAKYIQDISGERIKSELDKILLSNAERGLRLLDETGLLRFILPEVYALKSFSHNSKEFHLEGNMFEHTLLALNHPKAANLVLLYAILFHDIGKPKQAKSIGTHIKTSGHAEVGAEMFRKISARLKFSVKDRKRIEWAVRSHMMPLRFPDLSDKEKVLLVLHPDIDLLLALSHADDSANLRLQSDGSIFGGGSKKLPFADAFLKIAKVNFPRMEKLSSSDLVMKYGKLKPGPALGEKIFEVKTQIILGKIKNEKDLQTYLA